MTHSKVPPRLAVEEEGGGKANNAPLRNLPVHGHVIRMPSHIMFIGRNSKMKALVVIFRQGHKAYVYRLGDSFDKRLCCKLAQHPSPGGFISKYIKQFPVEDFV